LIKPVCLVVLLLLPHTAYGQADRLQAYQADIQNLFSKQPAATIEHLTNINYQPSRFLNYAVSPQGSAATLFDQTVANWERARVDKQIGKSLVSRGSAPSLLGLAVEAGAVTESVDGNAATLRANADGLLRFFAGQPIFQLGRTATPILKNLNVSGSVDLTRPGTKQVQVSNNSTVAIPTSSRRLSGFSVRYDIHNGRDVRSKAYQQRWRDWFAVKRPALESAGLHLLGTIGTALDLIVNDARYGAWRADFAAALANVTPVDAADVVGRFLDRIVELARQISPDFDAKVHAVELAYSGYLANYDDAIQELNGKPLVTFEYTNSRPANQPNLHNARLIYGVNPFGGSGLATLNMGSTLYRRLQDFEAGLELDRPLGGLVTHSAVGTLSAYYQYQLQAAVVKTDCGMLPVAKGNMIVLEAKVTLTMKSSGVKIPVGVTWSNRTDLIKGKDVRGHIGVSYDFDSLLAPK